MLETKVLKEMLEKRLAEIQIGLEQSAGNHNSLLGHLQATKWMIEEVVKKESELLAIKEGEVV